MALISCPECGQSVSDRAEMCIHCGYPLHQSSKDVEQEKMNTPEKKEEKPEGKPFRYFGYQGKTIIIRCDSCQTDLSMPVDSFTRISSSSCVTKCEITCPRCSNRVVSGYKMVKPDMPLPEEPYIELTTSKSFDEPKRSFQPTYYTPPKEPKLICPRCGSSSISTGARGVNWSWGLIGASKTVNRCGKCGHTWKPKG